MIVATEVPNPIVKIDDFSLCHGPFRNIYIPSFTESYKNRQFSGNLQLLDSYKNYIKHMEVYDDDVWVIGYPSTGITWLQEMVYQVKNNLKFDISKVHWLE